MSHHPFDQDLYDVSPDLYEKEVWGNSDPLLSRDEPPEGELHTVRVHRTPGLVRPWVARCLDCSWLHVGWRSACVDAADGHGYYTIVGEVA